MPLGIGMGVSGLLGLIGSKNSANASQQAAAEQQASTQQALQFAQQQYNTGQTQLAPYRAAGTTALAALGGLAGQPMVNASPGGWGYTPQAPAVAAPGNAPGAQTPLQLGSMGGAAGTGGMVMLEAPTGERQMVPQAQAAQYLQRGAKIVSAQGGPGPGAAGPKAV